MASGKTISPSKANTNLPKSPSYQALVDLPNDRNIFKSPWKEDNKAVETATLQKPHLSTICWSDKLSLAIINGEILTEKEKDSKFQFKVETITHDKVGIRFIGHGEYVWLLPPSDESEKLSF